MRVFVYYNLHKKTWSVKALEGESKGRVIMHTDSLSILNATFKVSEAGRQRVLRDKKKNVHAGVVGELAGQSEIAVASQAVTYNPYKLGYFHNKYTQERIDSADIVTFDGRSVRASRNDGKVEQIPLAQYMAVSEMRHSVLTNCNMSV